MPGQTSNENDFLLDNNPTSLPKYDKTEDNYLIFHSTLRDKFFIDNSRLWRKIEKCESFISMQNESAAHSI